MKNKTKLIMQNRSCLSIYVQAVRRIKIVLFALFFLILSPYFFEINLLSYLVEQRIFLFVGEAYAQEIQELTTLKTQGGKQRVEQDNFMVLSPPSSSHKKKEISLSRLKWSETCLLPADISEQRNSEKFVSFTNWLASFKNNAIRKGISSATVHSAFKNVHLIDRVVQLDRKQAEYALSFTNYINNAISISRIQRGRRKIQENAKILRKIQRKYGVSSEILIALWGLESNFGRFTGNFSTLNTLATLAYDGRRHNFFTNELLCALTMLDSDNITVKQMTGSWAGAMGQPQFMPSTFQYYATDGNGDGKKDIWQNTNDVLASAANYLYKLGWKKKEPWGVEVILPQNFTLYQAKLSVEKTLEQWGSLGVKKSNGKELQGTGRNGSIKSSMKGSIILPAGLTGPAFLVFHNFRIIREWNRSINYALAVGYLADRITGGSPLTRLDPQRDKNLSRQNAVMIQTVLASMGYYRDKIDGMVGIKSREAIREYQRDKGIPADGYPSDSLISRLRQEHL